MQLNVNIEENFWKLNPELKYMDEFKKLYDKDKGKDSSSRLMWAIFLFVDTKNAYSNIPEKDRRVLIAKQYLNKEDAWWEKCESAIKVFQDIYLSPAKRLMRNWTQKMGEREEFIKNTKYDLQTAELIDKMIATTKKLYEEYFRIQELLVEDGAQEKARGGRELSLTDRGDI